MEKCKLLALSTISIFPEGREHRIWSLAGEVWVGRNHQRVAKRTSDGPAVSNRVEERWHQWQCANTCGTCASLSLLAKSRMCHAPGEAWGGHRGVNLCQHLWEHFVSTHQTIRKDWSEFPTGTLSRGVFLNTSETSNTKLLAAVIFIWQIQPFLLIILRAVGFFGDQL